MCGVCGGRWHQELAAGTSPTHLPVLGFPSPAAGTFSASPGDWSDLEWCLLPRRWDYEAKEWERSPRQMGNCLILLLLLGVFIED